MTDLEVNMDSPNDDNIDLKTSILQVQNLQDLPRTAQK